MTDRISLTVQHNTSQLTMRYGPLLAQAVLDSLIEPASNPKNASPGRQISRMTSHKNCCG